MPAVCGFDVTEQPLQAKARIGYLPEGAPSYGEMTPRQLLKFVADLRQMSGNQRSRGIEEAVERLQLERVLEQPIETLSKGFQTACRSGPGDRP